MRKYENMKFIELNELPIQQLTSLSPQLSKDEQTPFIHLYRAEVGRLAVYKQRLDTTIHWTFTINLFIWSMIFQNYNNSDNSDNSDDKYKSYMNKIYILKSLSYFITIILHLIDARRYISYDEIKNRCVLMEKGMYACILNENECYKEWKQELLNTWIKPNDCKLSLMKSMKIRLRNIFGFIYISQTIFFVIHYLSIH